MPYIPIGLRREIREGETPETAGELNYALTAVIREYLNDHGLSYATCNAIVGALDNAKHEFRRRIQDPYEDQKARENGDVYPADLLAKLGQPYYPGDNREPTYIQSST